MRKEQLTQWHFLKIEGDDSLKASCALVVRKDRASGFKKQANVDVPKNIQSFQSINQSTSQLPNGLGKISG